MQGLGELFNKYGSDKDRNGYTPLYQTLFRSMRPAPINMLEIGIGTMLPGVHSSMQGYALPGYRPGGSLRAWRDYFPNGRIWGADVQPDTQFSNEPRITTVLCDSTKHDQLMSSVLAAQRFDIILDDGSHAPQDQIQTLKNCLPLLQPDGIYVIEDIFPGSWLSENLTALRAMFPDTHMFLVGKTSNQLVIVRK